MVLSFMLLFMVCLDHNQKEQNGGKGNGNGKPGKSREDEYENEDSSPNPGNSFFRESALYIALFMILLASQVEGGIPITFQQFVDKFLAKGEVGLMPHCWPSLIGWRIPELYR